MRPRPLGLLGCGPAISWALLECRTCYGDDLTVSQGEYCGTKQICPHHLLFSDGRQDSGKWLAGSEYCFVGRAIAVGGEPSQPASQGICRGDGGDRFWDAALVIRDLLLS